MNHRKLTSFLNSLDIKFDDSSSYSKNIGVYCPLAPWTHKSKQASKASMMISVSNTEVSLVKCWACGFQGTIYSLAKTLAEYSGGSYDEYKNRLNELERPSLEDFLEEIQTTKTTNHKSNQQKTISEEQFNKNFPEKVKSWRDLSESTLIKFNVRYDRKQKRIIVPIYDINKSIVGATGRTYVDKNPKWKNYFNFKKTNSLLFSDIHKNNKIIVCEGQVDCMRIYDALGSNGYDVCSILGSSPSEYQMDVISEYSTVYVFMDNDGAGYRGAEKLIEGLVTRNTSEIYMVCNGSLSAKDPGEMTLSMVQTNIEKSVHVGLTFGG